MISNAFIMLSSLFLLSAAAHGAVGTPAASAKAPAAPSTVEPPVNGSWPDECAGLPGYQQFRTALQSAVTRRDPAAFKALFARNGRMRMNGFGLESDAAKWSMTTETGRAVWSELDALLPLGCQRHGERLLIPYISKYDEAEVADDGYIVLRPSQLFADMDEHARPSAKLGTGEIVTLEDAYAGDGWMRVSHANGARGFVRSADVRSPRDMVLQLVREGDRWAIAWFTGYD